MPFLTLPAVLAIAVPLLQDAVIPPPPRLPLPRPAAGAPLAAVNQNLVAAGRRSHDTLVLALDVVEAAYQPEGAEDPVVRILALAERGKTPQVPGNLFRRCCQHSGIAECTENLGRVEGKSADLSETSNPRSFVTGPGSLGAVLYDS